MVNHQLKNGSLEGKKIPIALIINGVGFLAMMFFVGVQLLQKYGYVSTINWDKLGNDTSTQIQHWAANVEVTCTHLEFLLVAGWGWDF